MKAKKYLGQNFLVDNNIINKIIAEIPANENDLIIEIGPGRGALTSKLKTKSSFLVAYEIDTDLKPILDKFENNKVKILYKDFLTSNIKEDIKDINYDNLFIVGNLPYYITTPIIEHIIKEDLNIEKLIIMVQKEVGNRFMAEPKSKDYGYITLLLKYYYNITKVVDVSRYAFNPVPKVDSCVLSLTKKNNNKIIDTDKYFTFLKQAFKYKRKTLKNNLDSKDYLKAKEVLDKYNYSENTRAEEISEEVFIEIFMNLEN